MLILSSCNTWIGRQYVNTVTRYNRIYHSQKIITETDDAVKSGFKDDFNKILPIFNFGNETSLKGNGSEMDKILKKTSSIIEKHPQSKWTDDAWFLMGQSYFYRGDFFAAIETFEYVSGKYKKKDIAYKANLWTLYSYILLEKESESLAIISKLKGEKEFPEHYKKGLYLSAADIAVKQKKATTALENLNKALPLLKNKNEKIRVNYILGQLYQSVDSFEKASVHFNKVIKYNPPYDFNFNAQINLASALVQSKSKSYKKAQTVLKRMLNDDKNIEYYSKIYFELGKVDELSGNPKNALQNYKIAVHEKGNNNIIKTDAYNAIGNIYYNQNSFVLADKYFDSANQSLDASHPNFDKLSKIRENQSELLTHLVTLQTNDSLLMMANNPAKLEREIDRQIAAEKQKLKDEELQKRLKTNSPSPIANNPFNTNANNNAPVAGANASFPFYDPSLKARGVNDFRSKWGDRKLTDNWRVSSIASSTSDDYNNQNTETKDTTRTGNSKEISNNDNVPANIDDERKKYYKAIPYSTSQKDNLNEENKEALFALGMLYIYDLNESEKGISYLQQLQSRYPKNQNEEKVFYELAKAHKVEGNSSKYNQNFDLLARGYPESKYLAVLKNELISENESNKNNVNKEVQNLYNRAYNQYKNGNYDSVLIIKRMHDSKYGGNSIQSNFEYLEALTYAKMNRLRDYESKLISIIDNYPNTLVAENAARNLFFVQANNLVGDSASTTKASSDLFKKNAAAPHYSLLIFPLASNTTSIKTLLNDYHKQDYSLKIIELTEVVIGKNKCMVIKGFETVKANKDYLNVLKQNAVIPTDSGLENKAPISEENFKILLGNTNLVEYLKYANSVYKN